MRATWVQERVAREKVVKDWSARVSFWMERRSVLGQACRVSLCAKVVCWDAFAVAHSVIG